MSSSVIRGNTLDNSPNARITNTNTRIAHADHLLVHNELHVHLYAPISGFSHAVDFDVSRLSDLTRLQAWLSAGNRIAESRASSLPENFARRLTDSVVRKNAFRSCTLQESQTFLLKGRMGVGKTTTICGLIEHLRGRGDVAVAFMLVDSDSKSEHDARKILMLFILQVSDFGKEEHRIHIMKLLESNATRKPSAEAIVSTLVAIIKSRLRNKPKKTTCLLVDGLDEMEESSLHDLLCHLAEVQRLSSCGIIMASRVVSGSTESQFEKLEVLDITAHLDDIRSYVDEACRGPAVKNFVAKDSGNVAAIKKAVIAGSRDS